MSFHLIFVFSLFSGKVPDNAISWIFGGSSSFLTYWSQLDTVLSHFSHGDGFDGRTFQTQLQINVTAISELCSNYESDEDDELKSSLFMPKIMFLVEQLKLVNASNKRYSCSTLLWAFKMFATAPRAYSLLRDSVLTLPHPSYLRKLSSVFQMKSGFTDSKCHEAYLRQRCLKMQEHERDVILMIDEIHISHQLSYKGGKFEGSATNCQVSEASTAQVFMISSVLCKQKDVVAILPVKNIDAKYLQSLLLKTLQILHDVGYRVLCVISDNNRINRNAFTIMSGGRLTSSIPNPIVPSQKLFFLFDTVHLFKCIRNNWMSQKDLEKNIFISTSTNQ